MNKSKPSKPTAPKAARVREPIQVYLAGHERLVLDRLAAEAGLSRAEVLRRGIRSYAAERAGGSSPLFEFLVSLQGRNWPKDVAARHDAILAEEYAHR